MTHHLAPLCRYADRQLRQHPSQAYRWRNKPAADGQDDKEGDKAQAPKPKEPEPSTHSLENPARVVPAQEKLVKFPEGGRYAPIRPGRTAGILLLKDSSPGMYARLTLALLNAFAGSCSCPH